MINPLSDMIVYLERMPKLNENKLKRFIAAVFSTENVYRIDCNNWITICIQRDSIEGVEILLKLCPKESLVVKGTRIVNTSSTGALERFRSCPDGWLNLCKSMRMLRFLFNLLAEKTDYEFKINPIRFIYSTRQSSILTLLGATKSVSKNCTKTLFSREKLEPETGDFLLAAAAVDGNYFGLDETPMPKTEQNRVDKFKKAIIHQRIMLVATKVVAVCSSLAELDISVLEMIEIVSYSVWLFVLLPYHLQWKIVLLVKDSYKKKIEMENKSQVTKKRRVMQLEECLLACL